VHFELGKAVHITCMRLIRKIVSTNCLLSALSMIVGPGLMYSQALNMDGQSGVFFQPWADVVPAELNKFNAPTLGVHVVDAGPVAGDYFNASLEEGFGNWLEFGYTRSNHTDGGDPSLSPLFNFAGMNILNAKAKLIPAGYHKHKWMPAIAIGGVLRTNDPFVTQSFAHKNGTNGDIYGVATKLFVVAGGKFAFLINAGARGTNAQEYGYGGNTVNWQARGFGAISFPIPIAKKVVISPTFEIDQEPRQIKYIPGPTVPSDLIYAVRISRLPNSAWSIDIGTGHVGANLAPGINVKADNAVAFGFDYRFGSHAE
jgi:hypothetical protein